MMMNIATYVASASFTADWVMHTYLDNQELLPDRVSDHSTGRPRVPYRK